MWRTLGARNFGEKFFDKDTPVFKAFEEALFALQNYGDDFREHLNKLPNFQGLQNDQAKFTVVMRAQEYLAKVSAAAEI